MKRINAVNHGDVTHRVGFGAAAMNGAGSLRIVRFNRLATPHVDDLYVKLGCGVTRCEN